MHLPWRDVAPGPGPLISTSVTGAEAAELGRLAKGRRVLEIGSAFGYSSVVMALAGAEHVTAVDPHNWLNSLSTMTSHLDAYGVAGVVDIVKETSWTLLPHLVVEGYRFGLVFVDGDHRYEAVHHDLSWARDLLEPGGIIACHDVTETCCCPDVCRAVADVLGPDPGTITDTLLVVRAGGE